MTDLMKLHDEAVAAALDIAARSLGDRDNKTRAALQSAIEELQAENERLKADVNTLSVAYGSAVVERDALQSRLDAIGNGEAVAYGDAARRRGKQVGALWQFDDLGLSMFVGEIIGQRYAAPKELAPLTDEQIVDIAKALRMPFNMEFIRAIEAAHGIHAKGGQNEP